MRQKKKYTTYLLHLLRNVLATILILLAGLGSFSCTSEEKQVTPEPPPDKERLVTVYLKDSAPATYALDHEKESRVEKIDLLAFKNDGMQTFAYRREVDEFSAPTVNDPVYKRSFEVELPDDGSEYEYVFIANAREEVTNCLAKYPMVVGKDALLSHLTASNTGVWSTAGESFKRIPMWGEYGPVRPQGLDGKTIGLVRAVARVDVTVSAGNFTLKEVYVKNQYSYGRIVPDVANWNPAGEKVTGSTFPLDGDYLPPLTDNNLLQYPQPTNTLPYNNNIYLFETTVPKDPVNATHLIVGGTKEGSPGTQYYRVDFRDDFSLEPEDKGNEWDGTGPPPSGEGGGGFVGSKPYKGLLRNHHYQMNIISVSQNGYSAPGEASANTSAGRMLVEYINWDDQRNNVNIGNISYSFDISRVKVSFNKDFILDFIVVKTNYPGEWTIDKPAASDWFTCEKTGEGIQVDFQGDPQTGYSGYFNILLKNNNEVKYTKRIQVDYSAD